jgi:hypothetical protein
MFGYVLTVLGAVSIPSLRRHRAFRAGVRLQERSQLLHLLTHLFLLSPLLSRSLLTGATLWLLSLLSISLSYLLDPGFIFQVLSLVRTVLCVPIRSCLFTM